jgi:hypothetical protein
MTSSDRSDIVLGILAGLGICAVLYAIAHFGFGWLPPQPLTRPPSISAPSTNGWHDVMRGAIRHADFRNEPATADAHRLADWIATSHDAGDREFVMIDKRDAKIYVFDANARLEASAPVLLGAALGDDTAPGIGTRPLELVRPEEKTTPAGRFVGEPGHNARNEDVVWVDYDAAVSMHRVLTTNPAERRLERLATPTNADNRISFGCINLPKAFYEERIQPLFAKRRAIVYVMPDTKRLEDVFALGDSASIARGMHATQVVAAH